MNIVKMKVINIFQLKDVNIEFGDSKNIIIGDNDSGKSSVLRVIDYCLKGNPYLLNNVDISTILNLKCISDYLNTPDISYQNLPSFYCELFFDDANHADFYGNVNDNGESTYGIRMEFVFNPSFIDEVNALLLKGDFPYDYMQVKYRTFSGNNYPSHNCKVRSLILNTKNSTNSFNTSKIFNSDLFSTEIKLNQKSTFRSNMKNIPSLSNTIIENEQLTLGFGHDTYKLEQHLDLYYGDIPLSSYGEGTRLIKNIKISSLLNKNMNDCILLIEEPESHLSSQNLKKLLEFFENDFSSQIIISTHNNKIATRLGISNLIGLKKNVVDSNTEILNLTNIDKGDFQFFSKIQNTSLLDFLLCDDKIILVEGKTEYLLMEEFVRLVKPNVICEIISCDNLSFKRYLNIAKQLNKDVVAITDSDGNYNYISNRFSEYNVNPTDKTHSFAVFSNTENDLYSFEDNFLLKFDTNIMDELIKNVYPKKQLDTLEWMKQNKSEWAMIFLKELVSNQSIYNSNMIPDYIFSAIEWLFNES